MRIGIDARMYSTGFTGIGRYVHELVDHVARVDRKHEYVLFMNSPEYEAFEPRSKRVSKVLVNAPHYSVAEQTKFWWAIKRAKVDLMHFTHFNAPLLYRGPSIVTIHDLTLSMYPGKKMNSFLHQFAYQRTLKNAVKRAGKIIAVSGNTKKDLVEMLGVEPNKIEVVHLGVSETFGPRADGARNDALRKKYNIARDFVLYTGLWRSHKNVVNLIKAFALLRGEDSALEAQLVITGKEDPHYPEIKRTVKELGLEHDVVFTGYVPDEELVALYQEARVFAFPSLYEGFGLPPLEAMRCGTPVVASKCACIPEVCGEENALFFDPYDPEDISNSIRRLWLDEDLARELRERGLRHSRKFSWEKMAEKTVGLYA